MPRPEESATQSAGENRCPTARLLVRDWRMNAAPEPPVLSGSSAFSSAESRLVTKSIREDSPDLRQPTKLTHPPSPRGCAPAAVRQMVALTSAQIWELTQQLSSTLR